MPILSKRGVRCLFIHIPKTGGTSFERATWMLGWSASLIDIVRAKDLRPLKVTPQHYHAALLEQVVRWEEFALILTLCRHPFERVKSEFYWQQRQGMAPASTPEAWLSAVLKRCVREPWAFDNHLRPQVEFIPAEWNCEIFKLEDHGVGKAVGRVDSLAPADAVRRWSAHVVPFRRHKSRPIRKVEQAFADMRQRIEEFYAADMAFFGY